MRTLLALAASLLIAAPSFAANTTLSATDFTAGAAAAHSEMECVDVNTATVEELRRIIHIDKVRAKEIVALRSKEPFGSVDELVRVRGIAAGRLKDIKEQGLACTAPRPADRISGTL